MIVLTSSDPIKVVVKTSLAVISLLIYFLFYFHFVYILHTHTKNIGILAIYLSIFRFFSATG